MRYAFASIAALASVLGLAACSPEQQESARIRFNLVDPTIHADASIEGRTVTLDRGQALVVRLEENLSTGYRWESRVPRNDAVVIAPVRHDYTAGTTAASGAVAGAAAASAVVGASGADGAPATAVGASAVASAVPAIGGPGEATFRMRGVEAGSVPVVFEYRRPWETGAPAKTVAFEVVVR